MSIALAACGQPAETATPDNAPPLVTLLATVEALPTPTEMVATDVATEAASSIWPLAADLYYLTDQGQVYWQSFQSPDIAPVLITSPDVNVSDFALAPGSEWLLVRVDGTISVLSLAGKGGQEIATGTGSPMDPARRQAMDWSGDGSKVAFTSPDGLQIFVAAGAGLQPYVYAIPTPDTFVMDLRWSLDSRWIIAQMENLPSIACDVSDPAMLQCQDFAALGENPFLLSSSDAIKVAGVNWTANGHFDEIEISLRPMVMATHIAKIEAAGHVMSVAWGDEPQATVSTIPMPNTLYFLGPDAGLIQVWRLAPGADGPEVVTRALADVSAYDVSLDGTKVTYTSGGAIFVQTIGADDARQIVALPADAHSPTGTPTFSPTGRRIAFSDNGLFVYDTQTDNTSRLIPDSSPDAPAENLRWYDQPRYSPDGRWMIARRRTPSGSDVVVLPSGGTGINATPLNQPNARAEWTSDNQIVVYSDGGAFGLEQVNRFPAFRPGAPEVLLAAPAIDVQERLDGRLVALQQAFQLPFGPSTVRLFSFLPDGSDAQAETGSLVVESPLLSLDAVLIAGLIQTQVLGDGTVVGQLVIINPATQDVFVIDGMSHVQALMWGK